MGPRPAVDEVHADSRIRHERTRGQLEFGQGQLDRACAAGLLNVHELLLSCIQADNPKLVFGGLLLGRA
jgi:hypothetical protein